MRYLSSYKINVRKIVLVVLVFSLATYISFWFESSYRSLVRELYVFFIDSNISFVYPRKYIHFVSGEFVLSFGGFVVAVLLAAFQQTALKTVRSGLFSMFLFFSFLSMYCYVDGILKIVVCTQCNEGKRILSLDAIDYDLIFFLALFISIIPFWFKGIKKFITLRRLKNG